MPRPQVLRQPDGAGDVDAGGAAHAQSFLLQEVEHDRQGFAVGDAVGEVDRRAVHVLGHAALADAFSDGGAFGLQLAGGEIRVHRRTVGIGNGDLDVLVALLQRQRDAAEGAAGADRADEAVDLAVGLVPDLRAGGAVVAHAVGDVVELVGPDHAVGVARLQLLGQAAGDLHVVVRVLVGHGRHFLELGAGEAQHVLLLLRLGVRDHDQGLVAARVPDQRQTDAGVAGGALDDQAALAELAPPLGVLDDEEGRAVLDRAAGVEELRLAQDGAAGQLRSLLELDERGVADRADEAVADIHANSVGVGQGSRRLINGLPLPGSSRQTTPTGLLPTFYQICWGAWLNL